MNDETRDSGQGGPPNASKRSAEAASGRRVALSPSEAIHPERAPPPPRRKRPALEAFSGFLTFVLVAAVLGGAGAVFGSRALREPGPLTVDKTVLIAPGSNSGEIVEQLQREGVIDSPTLFSLALFVEGRRDKLKAGEYLFKQKASAQQVMDTIVSGKVVLHSLTIPEGLTSEQIVERLRQDPMLTGVIPTVPKEGALLPETYKFPRGDSREKLLHKMERDQKRLLAAIWRSRASDLPLASPEQLVILASIVEKETGKPEERPHVAGVFINRLRKHMRLQSDPTIVYGLVGGQGALGRPLTHADVEKPTPYNTYLIAGLPPGPIANPGRAALEAAANPDHTKDLYFVADGTGGHVFSESLRIHDRNVERLRKIEEEKSKSAPPPPSPPPPAAGSGHSERATHYIYGQAPTAAEFFAQRQATWRMGPRLAPDPAMMARVSPVMPDASPPPPGIADYALAPATSRAPQLALGDDLADARLGGVTRAENILDGPASGSPEAGPPAGAGARTRAAANLDGPAAPVESDALSYAGGAGGNAHPAANGKPRIYDASQGTALDPLLEKNWDLNSAHTVDLPKTATGASLTSP